jgi:hypothetical protein
MSTKVPQIGFDRYVELVWCQAAIDVAVGTKTTDQLRELVAESLPGVHSQRKTIDIVNRLWIKPFVGCEDFVSRGVALYQELGAKSVLPLAWGSAIAAYPFFGKTAEFSGRLLSLQGDCSIQEIQRRMAEAYGDKSGVQRAVARILQSQADWGVLKRDAGTKRILKLPPREITDDSLTTWVIEAAIRFVGKPISVQALQSLPVLFPFALTRPLAYLSSNCPHLDVRTEGSSSQFVGLLDTN